MIDINEAPWISYPSPWSEASKAAYSAMIVSLTPWQSLSPWVADPDNWTPVAISEYQITAGDVFTNYLEPVKAQLNLADCGPDDNALLVRKLAAAEAMVANSIGATSITYATAPAPLREAILLLAAHWYENREPVLVGITAQNLPLGYADLIAPYRAWVF